ncbi:MAG: hypothetical protein MJ154_01085 [Candidatus Saccharibacteria bacterium]|nr:hypothetical protein [Candidatus Saccharibacteria bacterium]
MSNKKKTNVARNYAVLVFVLVFVFFGAEVFAVCTAKNNYDYGRAKESSEELSVELGLISSSLSSGNKKLFEDSIERYNATLAGFANNEYVHRRHPELLNSLREYGNKLKTNRDEINEFLELSAALASIESELQISDGKKIEAVNFYNLQETFQKLLDVLEKIESENISTIKEPLESFSKEIISLSESTAICISVCPKSSFAEKQGKLKQIKEKYEKSLKDASVEASKKYDMSDLIKQLGEL